MSKAPRVLMRTGAVPTVIIDHTDNQVNTYSNLSRATRVLVTVSTMLVMKNDTTTTGQPGYSTGNRRDEPSHQHRNVCDSPRCPPSEAWYNFLLCLTTFIEQYQKLGTPTRVQRKNTHKKNPQTNNHHNHYKNTTITKAQLGALQTLHNKKKEKERTPINRKRGGQRAQTPRHTTAQHKSKTNKTNKQTNKQIRMTVCPS